MESEKRWVARADDAMCGPRYGERVSRQDAYLVRKAIIEGETEFF